jgi:hypothetical protein
MALRDVAFQALLVVEFLGGEFEERFQVSCKRVQDWVFVQIYPLAY